MKRLLKFLLKLLSPNSIELSEEELVIEWADAIIINSNYRGEVDRKSFQPDWVFSERAPTEKEIIEWNNNPAKQIRDKATAHIFPINGRWDIYIEELIKYLDKIKKHLLDEGFIEEPNIRDQFWKLTERGYLAKELGGTKKYKSYRKNQLNSVRNQLRVNMGLILATFLAAVMPFVVATIYKSNVVVNAPEYQLHSHNDTVFVRHIFEEEMSKIKSIPK